jgi:DNA repair protein SbcD/Mre11
VEKTRRGPDFFANFRRALQPALDGQVDLVVHGGDLFYRSRVPPALVDMALAPLIEVADRGVPVFLVPGNHERSRIPLHLWTLHPNLHIFDLPRTFTVSVRGATLSLSGFPSVGNGIREAFHACVEATGWRDEPAAARLLCLHEVVEGAQVGDTNYAFRAAPEVIPGRSIPSGFGAVLSGHIHRGQTLTRDLQGRPLAAPVIYPGAIERTAFVERLETKGYVRLEVDVDGPSVNRLRRAEFVPLPTRPMLIQEVGVSGLRGAALEERVRALLAELPANGIVRLALRGEGEAAARQALTAARLRDLAPAAMDVWVERERGDEQG